MKKLLLFVTMICFSSSFANAKDYLDANRKNKEVLQKNNPATLDQINGDDPYDKLQRSLLAFSNNRLLTVFLKLDHLFVTINFSSYLQSDMGLASKEFKVSESKMIEKFIPKVSKNQEYLKVEYSIVKKTDIIGAFKTNTVNIITGVEITGSPDLVVRLFLNYWPGDVNFTGYKKGEIATKQLLGDHIALSGVATNNYKIVIKKGNMDVDYESTFGINKKKNTQ